VTFRRGALIAAGVVVALSLSHHFVAIPSLGSFTARSLTGGDLEDLGGETDGWSMVVLVFALSGRKKKGSG
jgi:hypothetical protein